MTTSRTAPATSLDLDHLRDFDIDLRATAGRLDVRATIGTHDGELVHLTAAGRFPALARRVGTAPRRRDRPGDTPCGSWLAVPGGDQAGIVGELELTHCRPATMAMGVDTVDCDSRGGHSGIDRPSLSRVFVTPELAGWTLVLGNWVAPDSPNRRAAVAGHCLRLSERYGRAQAYGFDAQTWESAWLIAEHGQMVRHFIAEDTSVGDPLPVEREFLPYASGHAKIWVGGQFAPG